MLLTRMEIKFFAYDIEGTTYGEEYDASAILRPQFNFNNMLFSGQISPINDDAFYFAGRTYSVSVELPTISKKVFEKIRPSLTEEVIIPIQLASRVIGEAKLLEYIFVEEPYGIKKLSE